ncbi:hypothetical protein [Burkholderia sp. F1]|uniref:hypothetical protein n=1 Tax=Burkholderia sp. F1 TaxID=3366817 RepID=UPI003D74A530
MPLPKPIDHIFGIEMIDGVPVEVDPLPTINPKTGRHYSLIEQTRMQIERHRPRGLAMDMLQAVFAGDRGRVGELLGHPDFGFDVMRAIVIAAASGSMRDEERLRFIRACREDQKTLVERLERSRQGYIRRGDQVDKRRFMTWARDECGPVRNVAELVHAANRRFGSTMNYTSETLKAWYREAMPNVRLRAGRPKKKE